MTTIIDRKQKIDSLLLQLKWAKEDVINVNNLIELGQDGEAVKIIYIKN